MHTQDERPVFFVFTADGCNACSVFKANGMHELLGKIEATGRVRVSRVNLSKIGTPLPPTWPEDLNRFVGFYPCLGLMSGKLWNEAQRNPRIAINALIYNGRLDPTTNRIVPESGQPNFSHEAIMNWVMVNTGSVEGMNKSTINGPELTNTLNICAPGSKFRTRPGYW